jgi:hypothetical protein
MLAKRHRQDLEQLVPREWMKDASCGSSDPEAWQIGLGQRISGQVTRICGACLVREACLASALLYGEDGVWAGTSQNTRDEARHAIVDGIPAATVVKDLLDEAKPQVEPASPQLDGRRKQRHPCGTVAAYNRGCRCDECGAVGREYHRERTRAKRADAKAVAA